jgi:hypothetical protein
VLGRQESFLLIHPEHFPGRSASQPSRNQNPFTTEATEEHEGNPKSKSSPQRGAKQSFIWSESMKNLREKTRFRGSGNAGAKALYL